MGGWGATSCLDLLVGSDSDMVGDTTVSVLVATESSEDEVVDGATDMVRGQ